jgi:hypothetical protein
MAKGVLEEWLDYTRTRKVRGLAIAEQQATHVLAAEASAEIDAAEALYLTYLRGISKKAANGEPILESDRTTSKRNVAFAANCARAVPGFQLRRRTCTVQDSPLQRQYRNLLAANLRCRLERCCRHYSSILAPASRGEAAPETKLEQMSDYKLLYGSSPREDGPGYCGFGRL